MPLTPSPPLSSFPSFPQDLPLLFGKLSELGGARSPRALAPRPRSRWDGFGLEGRPASGIMSFSCSKYSQKRRWFKGSGSFWQEARQEMLSISFLQNKTRQRIISTNIPSVHNGILHNLRSRLDFLGLSDYICSNLAEPSNQQQLHQRHFLINQSSH